MKILIDIYRKNETGSFYINHLTLDEDDIIQAARNKAENTWGDFEDWSDSAEIVIDEVRT